MNSLLQPTVYCCFLRVLSVPNWLVHTDWLPVMHCCKWSQRARLLARQSRAARARHLVTDRCDSDVTSNTMESDYFCTRKACVYNIINIYCVGGKSAAMGTAEKRGSVAVTYIHTYKVYPAVLLGL